MSTPTQSEILTPEQIYEKIHAAVAATEGTDADVLSVIKEELLRTNVDEKTTAKTVVEKLLELAKKRTEESTDAPSS